MDHEERLRKYRTPREELDPETRALRDRHNAVKAARRDRGEFTPDSLAQRHLNDIPLPPDGSPAARKAHGEDE